MTAHAGLAVEIVTIRTTGDKVQDRPLSEIGGKGLFTREIEDGLLGGTLDIAVHSAKDMLPVLPEGLVLACFLERQDPRDALVSPGRIARIAELPRGATVATVALRRKALLLHARPDVRTVPIRGNVDTRLRKLDEGVAQALILARAGLNRLGRGEVGVPVPVEDFCRRRPGAVRRVPCRRRRAARPGRRSTTRRPRSVCAPSSRCRRCSRVLPYADRRVRRAHRWGLWLRALVARPDGSEVIAAERRGMVDDWRALGEDAGHELRDRAGPRFFEE